MSAPVDRAPLGYVTSDCFADQFLRTGMITRLRTEEERPHRTCRPTQRPSKRCEPQHYGCLIRADITCNILCISRLAENSPLARIAPSRPSARWRSLKFGARSDINLPAVAIISSNGNIELLPEYKIALCLNPMAMHSSHPETFTPRNYIKSHKRRLTGRNQQREIFLAY